MEFKIKNGPFIKSDNSTMKMMYNFIIALIPLILYSFYKNGIVVFIKENGNIINLFNPLIIVIIAMLVCLFTEYIWYLITKKDKTLLYLIEESYAIIPGIIIGLIIPNNCPIFLVILASIIASISKMICGGLGKNILNPAVLGTFIVMVLFKSSMGDVLNFSLNFNMISIILIILSFIYLCINKVVKYRITLSYIFSVFIIVLIVSVSNNLNILNSTIDLLFPILFFVCFVATDPITSPITYDGQIIFGIVLGILTMLFTLVIPYNLGILISILIMNILNLLINNISVKIRFNKVVRNIIIIFLILTTILFGIFSSFNYKNINLKNNESVII